MVIVFQILTLLLCLGFPAAGPSLLRPPLIAFSPFSFTFFFAVGKRGGVRVWWATWVWEEGRRL
jgi:hypothetical protein